jgi:hypothetical protein
MTIHQSPSFWQKIQRALAFGSGAERRPQPLQTETFEQPPRRPETRLEECMDGVEGDESALAFADVTRETLADMRQEESHSLERDPADPFFWREARPDAVAGMAKVHLKSRCPTPYWRGLVSSNAYGLWGLVAMARARAEQSGQLCMPNHGWLCVESSLTEQARLLAWSRSKASPGVLSDIGRADGLPIPGVFLGEINLHATLRLLFCAVSQGKQIDWPDLPARLGEEDEIPELLPALRVEASTLKATLAFVSREEAEAVWQAQADGSLRDFLMIPDWASWMLVGSLSKKPFPKWPARAPLGDNDAS